MKKTIRDFKLDGKKVLMRVDFNVPLDGKVITDDSRIKAALESINYAIENNAKLILFSHLARVENIEDMKKYSLDIVAKHLSELLNKKIILHSSEKRIRK